jgi:hypothetical protein
MQKASAESNPACLRRTRSDIIGKAAIPAGDSCRKELSSLELECLTHLSQGYGHGFVVCDCCSNVAREEECVCFQDYLHAVMHGEISQPQPEEKPSE